MFQSATERRYRRLAEERSAVTAAAIAAGTGHEVRVRRALALAVNAGIAADDAYPPLFRALAALGLVLRPVHFLPAWVPAFIGAVFGALMVLPVFVLMEFIAIRVPVLGGLAGWVPAGVVLGAVVVGTLFAVVIRLQAARARLPHWSQV